MCSLPSRYDLRCLKVTLNPNNKQTLDYLYIFLRLSI